MMRAGAFFPRAVAPAALLLRGVGGGWGLGCGHGGGGGGGRLLFSTLPRAPRAADAPSPHAAPPGSTPLSPAAAAPRGGLLGWALAKKDAAKAMIASYGWLFYAVYFGVYLVTLGGV